MQGRVVAVEQKNLQQGGGILKLTDTLQQRLNVEVAAQLKQLEKTIKKDNLLATAALVGTFVSFAGGITAFSILGAICPPVLILLPLAVLIPPIAPAMALGYMDNKQQAHLKEKWVLENYPESAYNENVKTLASQVFNKNLTEVKDQLALLIAKLEIDKDDSPSC